MSDRNERDAREPVTACEAGVVEETKLAAAGES